MRFLADENFPRTGLAALRERGYDVFSIAESGPGLSDELVAGICDREERVLLTFDKDFGELVFRRGLSSGSSVVLLRVTPEPGSLVDVIHSLIETGILTAGLFCVVARDRVRVRSTANSGVSLDSRCPRNHSRGGFSRSRFYSSDTLAGEGWYSVTQVSSRRRPVGSTTQNEN